ncbi:MAG TPA: S41 family peptidase [Steroidobacteraceae bacterium]|nr:S41 family peptidase [Steroidobacteraceae bacterium]
MCQTLRTREAALPLASSLAAVLMCALAACGGGGSGSSSSPNGNSPPGAWIKGVFPPQADFAARCAMPRSGVDPYTQQPYPDVQGTSTDENNWLRSWTNDLYLWYSEVPDLDPANYTTAAYFPLLKTSATDAQGQPKDKFHFTYATSTWEALSGSDLNVGYGAQFIVPQPSPPRQVLVAYTEPNSPATTAPASMLRGTSVLTIDGVDVVNGDAQTDVDTINAALSPQNVGEAHTFTVVDQGSTVQRTFTLTAANITDVPVQDVSVLPGTHIGYMLFTDQLATAEGALLNAITTLQSDGVTDLVIDIRYNGGGFLDIASELSYMIAGPGPTAGQTFELQRFNSQHPTTNPVSGDAITPTPFHATTQGFTPGLAAGQALPHLDLARVFVLTTGDTCSASEAVMNGLAGVGVQVIQIGGTTCGKPYGFYAQDNCGTTYFSIEFQGVNAKMFGDYPDGFTPGGSTAASFPGCPVSDDFTHALGDPNESLLYVASSYALTASCATPPAGLSPPPAHVHAQGTAIRSPVRQLRLMRRSTTPLR